MQMEKDDVTHIVSDRCNYPRSHDRTNCSHHSEGSAIEANTMVRSPMGTLGEKMMISSSVKWNWIIRVIVALIVLSAVLGRIL